MAFNPPINTENRKPTPESLRKLFSILMTSVDNNGIMGTIRILEQKDLNAYKNMIDLQRRICEQFKIEDVDELFGNTRGYPRIYAFSAWCHILFKTLNYKQEDMTQFSGKSESIISKSVKFYESLDDSSRLKRDVRKIVEQIRCEFIENEKNQ